MEIAEEGLRHNYGANVGQTEESFKATEDGRGFSYKIFPSFSNSTILV